ncbi:MAG: hypothetical protein QXS16_02080 [Pyrobaculum sp.]
MDAYLDAQTQPFVADGILEPDRGPSPHGFYTREIHNQSTTIPLEFRINKTGFLKIELWAHHLNKSLTYTGRSAHIYIETK